MSILQSKQRFKTLENVFVSILQSKQRFKTLENVFVSILQSKQRFKTLENVFVSIWTVVGLLRVYNVIRIMSIAFVKQTRSTVSQKARNFNFDHNLCKRTSVFKIVAMWKISTSP